MIPRTIHYCWYGGAPPNALMQRCLDSWRRVLPDFTIKRWDETNTPFDTPFCRAARARRAWSALSDHVRYHALHSEGGLYLDTDVEVLRDFTPLLAHEGFLGFQQEEEEEDWVNSAIMGLRPGSDFARRCLARNDELFARTGRFWRGPTVTTMVLKEMGLRRYGLQAVGGLTLYPVEAFSPFPWFGTWSPDCVRPETYCVHHWEASWQKSPLFSLRRRLRMVKRRVVGWLGSADR